MCHLHSFRWGIFQLSSFFGWFSLFFFLSNGSQFVIMVGIIYIKSQDWVFLNTFEKVTSLKLKHQGLLWVWFFFPLQDSSHHQDDYFIFRIGNLNQNLHLWLASWEGGHTQCLLLLFAILNLMARRHAASIFMKHNVIVFNCWRQSSKKACGLWLR